MYARTHTHTFILHALTHQGERTSPQFQLIHCFPVPAPGSRWEHPSLSNSKGSLATAPSVGEPQAPNNNLFYSRLLHHSPPGSCRHLREPLGPVVLSRAPQRQFPLRSCPPPPTPPNSLGAASSRHLLTTPTLRVASQHFHTIWVL